MFEKNRMVKRTLYSWGAILSKLVLLALLIPVASNIFSTDDFLFWQLMQSIVILGMSLDLGLSPTFSRHFSYAGSLAIEQRLIRYGELYRNLRSLLNYRVLPATLVLSVVTYLMIFESIYADEDNIYIFIIYSSMVYFQIGIGSRLAIIYGMNKIEISKAIEISVFVLQFLILLITLNLSDSLLIFSIVHLITSVFGYLFLLCVISRFGFGTESCRSRDGTILRESYSSGGGVILSQLIIHAPPMLLSSRVDIGDLSFYLLVIRGAILLSQVSSVFLYQALPRINELEVLGRVSEQSDLVRRSLFASLIVYIIFGVVAVTLVPVFFDDIFGKLDYNSTIMIIVLVAFLLERVLAFMNQLEAVKSSVNWFSTYLFSILSTLLVFWALSLIETSLLYSVVLATIAGYIFSILVVKLPNIIKLYPNIVDLLGATLALSLLCIVWSAF